MPQQPTYTQSIQPSGHVVEDDAPALRQALKLPGRERFRNIEKAKQDEGQKSVPPIGAASQKSDPLTGNFVDDNKLRIFAAGLARDAGRRRHAERNRKSDPND
jgi:hypothetical protein